MKILHRSQRKEIRRTYKTGKYTQAEVGDMFGVSASTVYLIVARKGNYGPRPKPPSGRKRKIVIDGNNYYVYADGRVWSSFTSKFLSVAKYTDQDGYSSMRVRLASKLYIFGRLMLECFVGPAPSKQHQCCHIDGDSLNCELSNLRWDLPQGNSDDKYAHGTQPYGERHFASKISDKQLRRLKKPQKCHIRL